MFALHINSIKITFKGCPDSGLDAIDWRRANGLEDRPSSEAFYFDPCLFTSEKICRLRPDLLDTDADMVLDDQTAALDICHVQKLQECQPQPGGKKLQREEVEAKLSTDHDFARALAALVLAIT